MAKTKTVIVFEIDEAEKGKPAHVVVSATREVDGVAEMPLMFTGLFPDRHQLADRAYIEVIKRKPQVPKGTAAAKPKPGAGKAKQAKANAAGPTAEAPDPMGPVTSDQGPASPPVSQPTALPVIEGDEQLALAMETEGSDG